MKFQARYSLGTALVLVCGLVLTAPVRAQQQSSGGPGSSVSSGPDRGGHSGPGDIRDANNGSTTKPPPTAPKGCGPLGIACNGDGGKGSNTDPSSPHQPPQQDPSEPDPKPKPPSPTPPPPPQKPYEPEGIPTDKPCKNCDPNL